MFKVYTTISNKTQNFLCNVAVRSDGDSFISVLDLAENMVYKFDLRYIIYNVI